MNPPLEDAEVRVLGSLIEKALSTPQYYPMTLNALTNACNQKSNRDPVVDYSERVVYQALEGLFRKRLAGRAMASSGRTEKYRHALVEVYGLDEPSLAVLASLMLRGPQTAGEVRGRTSRMHDFDSVEAVDEVLNTLAGGEEPFILLLPRLPGQKEARYAHLLSGAPDLDALEAAATTERPIPKTDRLDALEDEVAALREDLQALTEAFARFRRQFE